MQCVICRTIDVDPLGWQIFISKTGSLHVVHGRSPARVVNSELGEVIRYLILVDFVVFQPPGLRKQARVFGTLGK